MLSPCRFRRDSSPVTRTTAAVTTRRCEEITVTQRDLSLGVSRMSDGVERNLSGWVHGYPFAHSHQPPIPLVDKLNLFISSSFFQITVTGDFYCTSCPMRFTTASGLGRHMKMHIGGFLSSGWEITETSFRNSFESAPYWYWNPDRML